VAVCYYTKTVNGKVYPVKARLEPYAFSEEVYRDANGKVKTRYLGIQKLPGAAELRWRRTPRNNRRFVLENHVLEIQVMGDNLHIVNGSSVRVPTGYDVILRGPDMVYVCRACGCRPPKDLLLEHRDQFCEALKHEGVIVI